MALGFLLIHSLLQKPFLLFLFFASDSYLDEAKISIFPAVQKQSCANSESINYFALNFSHLAFPVSIWLKVM